MGMQMDQMRHISRLNPEARKGQTLPGAHLPPRGFYLLKSVGQTQNQSAPTSSLCGIPVWPFLQSSGPHSTLDGANCVSEPELQSTQPTKDQFVVVDIKTEESQEEQAGAQFQQGVGSASG